MTKRIPFVLAATALLSAGACTQSNDEPHPVAKVLPQAKDVRIALPESSANAFTVGQLADYYVTTREVTRGLNGGTGFVLALVHTIVQFPPTSVEGDTYTWGPWHDALDPAEWRLSVTELADGSYDWNFDGKGRTEAGAAFETVVSGNARDRAGRFFLDFDASERVNPIDNDGVGTLDATYDLDARTLALIVDDNANHYDYAYAEAADGAGDMTFAIVGDTDDVGPNPEEVTLRSRWLATGSGRADARIRGGDTATEVTASECWDGTFRRTFYADSATWQPTEGDAATCAFADQDLP